MDWEILGDKIDAEGEVFTIAQAVRRQHLYVPGRTGSGKTTLLARLALGDIARGHGLLVLDPHGDLAEDIIDHCPPEHRDRIIYLDLTDREHPVPLNLFECRPGQDKDTVCSEVIGIFKRLYEEMWGPQLEDLLRNLTLAMLDHQLLGRNDVPAEHRYNATLREAHDFLFNQNMRREYYPYLTNPIVHSFWTNQYDRMGTLQRGATVTFGQIKYASSTTNKIRRFLLNPIVFDITANNRLPSAINLREIMDQQKVLLVNLSKGKLGEDNSALLGSMMLSQLAVAALSRADMPREERERAVFHVIADEFQSFATERFKLLLSEARKYAVTLAIAHQFRDQLDQEMKGAALNCGSLICFRVVGRDAVDLAREYDATPQPLGWRFERIRKVTDLIEHGVDPEADRIATRYFEAKKEHDAYVNTIWMAEYSRDQQQRKLDKLDAAGKDRLTQSYAYRDTVEERRMLANGSGEVIGREIVVERQGISTLERQDITHGLAIAQREYEEKNRIYQPLLQAMKAAYADLVACQSPQVEWEDDDDSIEVDERTRYVARYRRVEQLGTFSERERELANALTQLPNFTAMTRLADGAHVTLSTRNLPPTSPVRVQRIDDEKNLTRINFAVRPQERPSMQHPAYFDALHRQQAYEAELDEQP